MQEIKIKSHLIVTDIHNEYHINWCGRILDCKPQFKNGKPIFIISGGNGCMELNTTDMLRVEECAKACTKPKGRSSISTDIARIYILEEDDNQRLLGTLEHNRVKTFAPMYDKVGWKD